MPSWVGVCIDDDGDGYGLSCKAGADCDDQNAQLHAGCGLCDKPSEGCDCDPAHDPIDCTVPPELTSAGSLLCREGTRYCRDAHWTACEGITSFLAPPPELESRRKLQGLIGHDASVRCGVCSPDCNEVSDPLVFDGGAASGIAASVNGGITLVGGGGGGSGSTGGGLLDDYACVPGTAPDVDCDGIPDSFDVSSDAPPFQTDHKTIFMELGPGQSGSQNLTVNFNLAAADIYFYLDMTGSMGPTRDNLIASLTSGNYLPAAVAGKDCADRDLDGSPDNYLKDLGVAGNIACLIRDARFGAGWFRDLPFAAHGQPDFEMFEHRLDLTADVGALMTTLQGFQTRGGVDLPEGSSQGLWALPTAGEVHVGWDRPGIPARTTCPAGTWGHACFRSAAVPIVIHVTDDGMNNGPPTTSGGATYPFSYLSANLTGMKVGTPDTSGRYYRPLTSTAETFASAQDVGTVDNSFITYAGSTEKMAPDLTYLTTGSCPSGTAWDASAQAGRDAVFKFTVGSKLAGVNRNIKLSSSGSRFNSSLLLLGTPPTYTGISAANNGTFATAQNLGTIAPGRLVVSGDTSALSSVYARESLTSSAGCFVGATASDLAPASVLKFRLSADQTLRFTTSAGAPLNSALFSGSALEPKTTNLATLDCGAGVASNCHDKIGQFSLGELGGEHRHLIGGDTSNANVKSDYSADFASCGGATYAGAGDSVVDFTLAAAKTLRFETSGSGSDLQAGFPHGLAIVRKPSALGGSKAVPAGNTDQNTAYTILESDIPAPGTFVSFVGNSASDTPTYSQAEVGGSASTVCNHGAGGASADKDVVFKLAVTATQKYEFDTAPTPVSSGYKTWLSLHQGSIGRATSLAISNAAELDTPTGQAVAVQAQGSIDNRQIVLTGGQINQRDGNVSRAIMGNNCGSTLNSPGGMGGRDAVFRFYAATSGTVTITTVNSLGAAGTTPNFNSFFAVYKSSVAGGNLVSPNCPSPPLLGLFGPPSDQPGNGWTQTLSTTAGTEYLIVVKEWAYDTSPTVSKGQFGLIIQDARYASSFVDCDTGSSPSGSNFSRLSATLTPGTYYLVLKGTGAGANYNYSLNVRKPGASTTGTTVACANSASNRAVIPSLTLPAGEYSAIIKGQRTTSCILFFCSNTEESGAYNLTIRDLAVAPVPLACSNGASSASMTPALLKKNDTMGNPIDYYLVTRGNTVGSAYQVMIEDSSAASPGAASACDDDSGQAANAELIRALAPGTYYAVLKGRTAADYGMFQMSIGEDRSGVTSTATFVPKTWAGAGGVREALINNKVRVITVDALPTANLLRGSAAYKQSLVLAQDTGAPTVSSSITYEISNSGTGMGGAVITAVNDLANALSMNLGMVLTTIAPNVPAKPFAFTVQALPNSGNCSAPIDTDNNGIADTHVACKPGAVPAFNITITNPPAPNNVPLSALDANGGYQMKLQLIGDGKFVVDEVPVYVIPRVPAVPSASLYPSTGTYDQTIASNCSGTEAPTWRSLYWNASLPAGTSLSWNLCTGNSSAELSSCSLRTAATVTSGAACADNSQCSDGYCAGSGVCEYAVGPSCSASSACGAGGVCVGGTCRWTRNPIDLMPTLLTGQQGKSMMRVNVTLNASTDRTLAPSVRDWKLSYVCSPQL